MAFQNILDELGGNDFLFIGAPSYEVEDLVLFFSNLHAKRVHKKIQTRGIVNTSARKKYTAMFKGKKNVEMRFLSLPFPHAVGIGKKRVIISLWLPTAIAFEIESERMTKRYRDFFEQMWLGAKK
jgi:hypothetical protein